MTDPKKACRKCYAHADSLDEALAAGPYGVAKTGTVHKVSEENAAKTECGQDTKAMELYVPGEPGLTTLTFDTSDSTANAESERVPVPAGNRRRRVAHKPPSARWTPEELDAARAKQG